jgi:hypothetical protein
MYPIGSTFRACNRRSCEREKCSRFAMRLRRQRFLRFAAAE